MRDLMHHDGKQHRYNEDGNELWSG